MRTNAITIAAALALACAFTAPVLAQESSAAVSPPSADESALLGNALTFDPANMAGSAPARPLRMPSLSTTKDLDVSRTDRPDGSSIMVVKQPLPVDWDSQIGADLGFDSTAPGSYQPRRPLPAQTERNTGAAWASVGVPHIGTLDARLDPSNDQGRLGATIKQPIGSSFAVTLRNSISVTETSTSSVPAPADFPVTTVPRTATATPVPPQVWGNERVAKFDILPTGTTFGAGLASASNDPVTHNKFSAEQKLYGPLHVTTAVTDVDQPTASKSISAGFRLNW